MFRVTAEAITANSQLVFATLDAMQPSARLMAALQKWVLGQAEGAWGAGWARQTFVKGAGRVLGEWRLNASLMARLQHRVSQGGRVGRLGWEEGGRHGACQAREQAAFVLRQSM